MTVDLIRIEEDQQLFCKQQAVGYVATRAEAKTGFALSSKGELPINGLRHPPAETTSGWFIWCGEEFSEASDFFSPFCTRHLYEDQPQLARLLGLPPGYCFLLAGDYIVVWLDPGLLEAQG